MTLNRREQYIALVTAAVVGLLLLDTFVITPWLAARDEVRVRLESARHELERADQLFDNQRRANRRWSELAGDALTADAPAAESQFLNALRDWAQASRLALTAVRPDRGQATQGFQQITVRLTGGGRMEQVAAFLWQMETAEIPVRLTDMQLAARQPGSDDLSLQLTVSTIYLPPEDGGARSER